MKDGVTGNRPGRATVDTPKVFCLSKTTAMKTEWPTVATGRIDVRPAWSVDDGI
ncbi:hypothetical protein [Haladaptatus sp. NG-WS-4]